MLRKIGLKIPESATGFSVFRLVVIGLAKVDLVVRRL